MALPPGALYTLKEGVGAGKLLIDIGRLLQEDERKEMMVGLNRNHSTSSDIIIFTANDLNGPVPSFANIMKKLKSFPQLVDSSAKPPMYNGLVEGLRLIRKPAIVDKYFVQVGNPEPTPSERPAPDTAYEKQPGIFYTSTYPSGELHSEVKASVPSEQLKLMMEGLAAQYEDERTLFTADDLAVERPELSTILDRLENHQLIDTRSKPPNYNGLVQGLKFVDNGTQVIRKYFSNIGMESDPDLSTSSFESVAGSQSAPTVSSVGQALAEVNLTDENKKIHQKVLLCLYDDFTEDDIGKFVQHLVSGGILPRGMLKEKGVHIIMDALEHPDPHRVKPGDSPFLSPGNYGKLCQTLRDCNLAVVASDVEREISNNTS